MQGGLEVIAMVISAIIGFVAGIVATILIRESPRPATPTAFRHRQDFDTGPQPVIDRGWGGTQTRSENPPYDDADSGPLPALNTASQRKIISPEATARQRIMAVTTAPVPLHVTTRSGAPVGMLMAESLGKRWLLRSGESASIGRFDDNAIAIDDEEVSRLHAQISHRTDTGEVHEFTIFDYTSTNGTLVNGKPIRGVASLQDGDLIKIGNTELQFRRVKNTP